MKRCLDATLQAKARAFPPYQASSNYTVFDRFADEFLSGRNSRLKTFEHAAVDAVLNYSIPAGGDDPSERIYLTISEDSLDMCNLESFKDKDTMLCNKEACALTQQ